MVMIINFLNFIIAMVIKIYKRLINPRVVDGIIMMAISQ